ncbi:MAG: hypothetical protein ACUVX9_12140 [Anaerolineae bacterium]
MVMSSRTRAGARGLRGERRRRHLLLLWLSLLLLLFSACRRGSGTPQPGMLTYEGPQMYTLKPGEVLPGTSIRYLGPAGGMARFEIAGQQADKQKLDSLFWSGSPVSGVTIDLRLRVLWFTDAEVHVAGTAKVSLTGTDPRPGPFPEQAPLRYQMPVAYSILVGETAPGTGLTYEGKTAEGARFGGLEGYAYRQVGDSLRWEGTLRDRVAVRQDVRLLQYDDKTARLAGTVQLWMTP